MDQSLVQIIKFDIGVKMYIKPGGLTLTHKCYPPVCTHLQIGP